MSYNIFYISDTHFTHTNILTFKNQWGGPLRPFSTVYEMDEEIIARWNRVVKSGDKVYHLGDVGFNRNSLSHILPRLNGTKILVRGNHDKFKLSFYSKHFKDVRGYAFVDKFILSHIPIHPDSLSRYKLNIHGHLHSRILEDHRYLNVSVEQTDYTPINHEDLKVLIND